MSTSSRKSVNICKSVLTGNRRRNNIGSYSLETQSFPCPIRSSGKAGISFVNTLAGLFHAYGECSTLESITLRAMILPILPLLNPHAQSKTKDHVACLQRCLTTWRTGDIDALVREGRTIQSQFQTTPSSGEMRDQQQDQTTRLFINHMKHGSVKAAICLLDNLKKGGVLSLNTPIQPNTTVCEALK